MSDLDDFLNEAHDAGRYDSTGHFTLAYQQASRKLAQFQSAEPGFFLLKLIQACVVAEAEAIHLESGTHSLTLRALQGTWVGLDWRTLGLDPVGAQLASHDTIQRHVAIGLGACLSLDPLRVECRLGKHLKLGLEPWKSAAGEATYRPVCEGDAEPQAGTSLEEPRARMDLTVYIDLPRRHSPDSFANTQALARCRRSPTPIWLQGFLLSECLNIQDAPQGDPLAELHLGPPARPSQGLVVVSKQRACFENPPSLRTHTSAHLVLREYRDPVAPSRIFSIPYGKYTTQLEVPVCATVVHVMEGKSPGPSRIHFIKAGVALDPLSVDWDLPPCRVYLSGWNLPVDLSELKVQESEELQRTLQEAREVARRALLRARKSLEIKVSPEEAGKAEEIIGVATCVASLLLLAAGPPGLVAGALGGSIGGMLWWHGGDTRRYAERLEVLREQLKTLTMI